MEPKIVTGSEAYRPEAEDLVEEMRPKPFDEKVSILADTLRAHHAGGIHVGRRAVIDESEIAVALTSAAARFVGLAQRDRVPDDAFDRCESALSRAIGGLAEFGQLAGSDTGTEGIQAVLRELVDYVRGRDAEAAMAALDGGLTGRAQGGL